jgi:hypothetical protein
MRRSTNRARYTYGSYLTTTVTAAKRIAWMCANEQSRVKLLTTKDRADERRRLIIQRYKSNKLMVAQRQDFSRSPKRLPRLRFPTIRARLPYVGDYGRAVIRPYPFRPGPFRSGAFRQGPILSVTFRPDPFRRDSFMHRSVPP